MKAKLSMAFEDLRGKDGNVVIRKGRTGLVLTPLVTPRNPKTAAQELARQHLGDAATTFKGLTTSQVQAWDNYVATLNRTNPISGESYHPTAINEFCALASKFLQVTPGGTIPVTPPATKFLGDSLSFTVVVGTGTLTITPSAGNTAGTTTEFLVQPLNSPHVTPHADAYTHEAFHEFVDNLDELVLNLGAGYWSLAYRYVNTATGQMTELIQLDIEQVTFSLVGNEPKGKKKAA